MTSQIKGKGIWREAHGSTHFPTRDFAQHYRSFQEIEFGVNDSAFTLGPEDGDSFYQHIIRNPDNFPFGPAPIIANPLPGQGWNLVQQFCRLLNAHNLQSRDRRSYGGPGIHGARDEFDYAVDFGLDPIKHANVFGKPPFERPPPNHQRYKNTIYGSNPPPGSGIQGFGRLPNFPSGYGYTNDPSYRTNDVGHLDESGENYEDDEDAEENENEDSEEVSGVGNEDDWAENNSQAWEHYRKNFPNNVSDEGDHKFLPN